MTDNRNIPLETLQNYKIDIWHFLEDVYGHDQSRHPFYDSAMALEWYTRHVDSKVFMKSVSEYYQEYCI